LKVIHREFKTSEAGIALSVVTAVVIGLGYVALHFLSGSSDTPPIEFRQAGHGELATGNANQETTQKEQLQVLPVQESSAQDVPHVSQRPIWEPKPFSGSGHDIDLNGSDSLWPSTEQLPVGLAPPADLPR
jgi:hypothetical protein